jgi:hypothetical protein
MTLQRRTKMPDKTPKPEDIPTLEDIEKEWGYDKMSMFHSMVSPDDPKEHGEDESEQKPS